MLTEQHSQKFGAWFFLVLTAWYFAALPAAAIDMQEPAQLRLLVRDAAGRATQREGRTRSDLVARRRAQGRVRRGAQARSVSQFRVAALGADRPVEEGPGDGPMERR